MRVSKNVGVTFWGGPYTEDHNIFGSILRPMFFLGNYHTSGLILETGIRPIRPFRGIISTVIGPSLECGAWGPEFRVFEYDKV